MMIKRGSKIPFKTLKGHMCLLHEQKKRKEKKKKLNDSAPSSVMFKKSSHVQSEVLGPPGVLEEDPGGPSKNELFNSIVALWALSQTVTITERSRLMLTVSHLQGCYVICDLRPELDSDMGNII